MLASILRTVCRAALALTLTGLLPKIGLAQTPLAQTQFDVNGDRAPDLIRVDDPPSVSVTLSGTDTTLWKPFAIADAATATGATITSSTVGKRGVVVATVFFAAARGQAMILAWQGKDLVKLWEGSVGRQGPDGDYSIHVEATEKGLLRYQTRPDVHRCDHLTTYLFPEAYDFSENRFRPIYNRTRMPAGAPVIRAGKQAPTGGHPGPAVGFRSRAASAQDSAGHAGELAPPREVDDADPKTAWRTGGTGRGEVITLTAPDGTPAIVAVRIIPGDSSSKEEFLRQNRLKRAGLLIDTDKAFWIEFPVDPGRDGRFDEPYWIALPDGVHGRCVSLIVDEVYPGGRGATTAIADLAVLTELDLAAGGPDAILAGQAAGGGAAGETASRMLVSRGPRATAAVISALQAGGTNAEAGLRLRRVLARIHDPQNARALAEHLVDGFSENPLSPGDARLFTSALLRLGTPAVPALSALLAAEDASAAARKRAARVLATIPGPEAQNALIRAAGTGNRTLRQAVAVALGHRDTGELGGLLAALSGREQEPGQEADLWRAVGLMGRRADAAGKDAAAAAVTARLVHVEGSGGLSTAGGYELLYRLAAAGAGLDRDTGLAALGASIKGAGALAGKTPQARAIRRVVASALADNPSPQARALLLALSRDEDPGVRRHAVAGLGQRDDATAATDEALASRLTSDTWPRIRQAAAGALARGCTSREAPRLALYRAVDADPDLEVKRTALTALVDCRASGIGDRLVAVARDRGMPAKLRQSAVSLIPALGDARLAGPLIELFASQRKAAWSDKDAVTLAAAAAAALGRLGTPEVVAPLMDAARDETFFEIQAAAITGLGEMCPPQAMAVFENALQSPQRAVAVAARGARNRCRQ